MSTESAEAELANVESKATLQIRGPYFVAVLLLDQDRERVVRADVELDFMVGWTVKKVMSQGLT